MIADDYILIGIAAGCILLVAVGIFAGNAYLKEKDEWCQSKGYDYDIEHSCYKINPDETLCKRAWEYDAKGVRRFTEVGPCT